MVNTSSDKTLTETWQAMSWQSFQKLTHQPKSEQARFYYDHGYMKIEMSPLGLNHGRDNAIAARVISLPTLQMTIVEEALEKGRTTDDGTINRWLIQLFSE
jgi:Uma2 family endonuclease